MGTPKKDSSRNSNPVKMTDAGRGQQDQRNALEDNSDEKIAPMSDKEEKMINYQEQLEIMRKKIRTLEEENRKLRSDLENKLFNFEEEKTSVTLRNVSKTHERPKTTIIPELGRVRFRFDKFEKEEAPKQRDEHLLQIRQLQDEKDTLSTSLRLCESELRTVKEDKRLAKETITKLKKEKDDLLNRLSEIASVRLSHENTDITDLSDENRPGKLAEKISEMYDNQWQNAFEELKANGVDKIKAIQLLLKILMEIYEICKMLIWNRLNKLTEDCSRFTLSWKMEGDAKREEKATLSTQLSQEQKISIKEICLGTSKALEKQIRPVIMRMVEDKINFRVQQMEKTDRYIENCIELCWKMSHHEKPMHLDTNVEIKDGHPHFDTEKFRAYRKTGKNIAFVVWPALYLYEGGPILARGVAQGLKENESESASTQRSDES